MRFITLVSGHITTATNCTFSGCSSRKASGSKNSKDRVPSFFLKRGHIIPLCKSISSLRDLLENYPNPGSSSSFSDSMFPSFVPESTVCLQHWQSSSPQKLVTNTCYGHYRVLSQEENGKDKATLENIHISPMSSNHARISFHDGESYGQDKVPVPRNNLSPLHGKNDNIDRGE